MMGDSGRFDLRGLNAMTNLTELCIMAPLEENESLETLCLLKDLAIDYDPMISWRRHASLVISDAASITRLHWRMMHMVGTQILPCDITTLSSQPPWNAEQFCL